MIIDGLKYWGGLNLLNTNSGLGNNGNNQYSKYLKTNSEYGIPVISLLIL